MRIIKAPRNPSIRPTRSSSSVRGQRWRDPVATIAHKAWPTPCLCHLSHPYTLVMESAEEGDGRDRSSRLDRTAERSVLRESDSPAHRPIQQLGQLAARPILSGLHHHYY